MPAAYVSLDSKYYKLEHFFHGLDKTVFWNLSKPWVVMTTLNGDKVIIKPSFQGNIDVLLEKSRIPFFGVTWKFIQLIHSHGPLRYFSLFSRTVALFESCERFKKLTVSRFTLATKCSPLSLLAFQTVKRRQCRFSTIKYTMQCKESGTSSEED